MSNTKLLKFKEAPKKYKSGSNMTDAGASGLFNSFSSLFGQGQGIGGGIGTILENKGGIIGNTAQGVGALVQGANQKEGVDMTNVGGAEKGLDVAGGIATQMGGASGAIAGVGNAAGELVGDIGKKIQGYDKDGNPIYVQSTGGALGEGVLRGGATGASIGLKVAGPYGAAIGGVIGGVAGGIGKVINKGKQQREADEMIRRGNFLNSVQSQKNADAAQGRAMLEQQQQQAAINNPFGVFKKGGNLIPREEMPQFDRSDKAALKQEVMGLGFKVKEKTYDPFKLKSSQSGTDMKKVENKAKIKSYKEGTVIVGSDNKIIDGHHDTEAAKKNNDSIKILVVDKPAKAAIAYINKNKN